MKMMLDKILRLKKLVAFRFRNVYLILIIFLVALLAIRNSFIQDDAFISFRYAHNLVAHHNFSWNETDSAKIEGYTNFLWTILIAGFIQMNFDPVIASMIMGILLGMGTVFITYKIAALILEDFRYALLAALLLGTNYSFNSYMTGGLETQLQTFLISLICLFSFKVMLMKNGSVVVKLLLIGLFSALAILTRLDSPLIIGLLVLSLLYHRYLTAGEKPFKIIYHLVLMAIPVLLIVIPWLYWKYTYYGDLLPNSFYLKGKVFSWEVLKFGIYYLFAFFGGYYLLVFFVILPFQSGKIFQNRFIITFVVILVAWSAYILKVGGDFMEFRFMVPVLPLLVITILWSIKQLEGSTARYVCILVILSGTISHQVTFYSFHGIESIVKLNDHIYKSDANWAGIGTKLRQHFYDARDRITIATTAAGAIPYYSELPTIDMLGINDKWIAIHGEAMEHFRPGHHKWAKLDYYINANTHLIFGHPQVRTKNWTENRKGLSLIDFEDFKIANVQRTDLPNNARIITIPIDETYNVFALYLTPLPEIEALIKNGTFESFAIE